MPALRTSLVALAVGGAAVATGLVATTATAAPAPLAAVSAASADTTSTADGAGGADRTTHPVRAGLRQWWQGLTDEQRQCMEDADLRRPVGPLDDAERATLREQVRTAAEGCGVELPFPKARAFWNDLSDEQRQCLEDADLTRPVGPMTKEQRQQLRSEFRTAAESCGVTLPERPAAQQPS